MKLSEIISRASEDELCDWTQRIVEDWEAYYGGEVPGTAVGGGGWCRADYEGALMRVAHEVAGRLSVNERAREGERRTLEADRLLSEAYQPNWAK